MGSKFSFVTNATSADAIRLATFLPGVLKTFGHIIDEFIVVLDRKPEEGRIKQLHNVKMVDSYALEDIQRKYASSNVKFIELDYARMDTISRKWFGRDGINRCQNGTPIFAFLYGIEICKNDFVLRADCDILFFDNGMITELEKMAKLCDIIQLPFLNNKLTPFSTRCFFINRARISSILPIQPAKLDPVRQIGRILSGRSTYLALEQILEREIQQGSIALSQMKTSLGCTMHIPNRSMFEHIGNIAEKFQKGQIPEAQLQELHDYFPRYWMQ